jgi:asparagine synthase (glutamine-hydrolysing)
VADVLAARGDPVALYQVAYALFTRRFLARLAADGDPEGFAWGLSAERRAALRRRVRGAPGLHAISTLELASFVGERLLRDTDTTSMSVSLEVRVPLLDHRVVEAVATLGVDDRFAPLGGKRLLRELALRDLPEGVFERPKAGFELPMDGWIRSLTRDTVDAALSDADRCRAAGLDPAAVRSLWTAYLSGRRGLYWSRIWSLYVLLRWIRRHRVSV